MAYTKNVWVNGDASKPLDQDRLNHNEDGTFLAAATADAASAAAASAAGGVAALETLTDSGRLSETALNATMGKKIVADVKAPVARADRGLASKVSRGLARKTIIAGDGYDAFPSMARLTDGRLLAAHRHGVDHFTAGSIDVQLSADLGSTWTEPATITTSNQVRGTGMSLIDGTVFLSGFLYNWSTEAKPQVFVMTASEDSDLTDPASWTTTAVATRDLVATQAKVVLSTDGSLLLPVYVGETDEREVLLYRSTDAGASWVEFATIASDVGSDFNEAHMDRLADGSLMTIIRRDDTTFRFYRTVSVDEGATWSTPVILTETVGGAEVGARGFPGWVQTHRGTIVMVYRRNFLASGKREAIWRTSDDDGVTWGPEREWDRQPDTQQMVYAYPVEVSDNLVAVAYSLEYSDTGADIFMRYCTDGDGLTPLGDIPWSAREAALGIGATAFDTFSRPDESQLTTTDSSHRWDNLVGSIAVASRVADTTALDGGLAVAMFDSKIAHGVVDAELAWGSTGSSGVGMIFRGIDVDNYLYIAIESSGTTIRLKKNDAATTTVLASLVLTITPSAGGRFYPFRVVFNGDWIRVLFNGLAVIEHQLSSGDNTKYSGATQVGLRTTNGSHRCRSIVARTVINGYA